MIIAGSIDVVRIAAKFGKKVHDAPPALFFFFSSRRRHTRFDCDWSSDVCSSDLHLFGKLPAAHRARLLAGRVDLGDDHLVRSAEAAGELVEEACEPGVAVRLEDQDRKSVV